MRAPRYTIWHVMVGIAVLALLLAIPRLVTSSSLPYVAGVVALFPGLAALNVVAGSVFGIPCPACSRWTLRRLARHRNYYRCSSCRLRVKRFGFGPWLDASGPEDAGRYRQNTESRPWEGFAVPEDLEGTSSGLLLGNKRSRGGPVVEPRPPLPPGDGRPSEASRRKIGNVVNAWREMRAGTGEGSSDPTPPG